MSIMAEKDVYGVSDEVLVKSREQLRSGLLGRLLTNKSYNKAAFKSTMTSVWRIEISEVARDIYLFSFADVKELDRVLEREPWSFDYSLLVLKRVEDMENLDLADFCYTNFWVQTHNLPLNSRVPEVGELIGDIVGNLVRVTYQ